MAASRSWLKYGAIGCGGLLLVGAALAAGIFFFVSRMTAEPERVVKEFLAFAAAGDYEAAHGHFSVPLKEAQPLEVFSASVKARPSLLDVADTSFTSRSIDAGSIARLEGTATLRAGTTVPVSFSLTLENGAWKLLGYRIGSDD